MAKKPPAPPVKMVRVRNLDRQRRDLLLTNGNAVNLPPKSKRARWPEINANLVSPSMRALVAGGHIVIEEV